MSSHPAGQVADSEGVFEDGIFEWRLLETPGEGSRDGEQWFQFFQMTLEKVG